MSTEKMNESEMEVTKEAIIPEVVKVVYSIDFLKQQELDILKSMNDFVAQRQIELEEVRNLLVECEKLGLKTQEVILSEQVIAEQTKLDATPIETLQDNKQPIL